MLHCLFCPTTVPVVEATKNPLLEICCYDEIPELKKASSSSSSPTTATVFSSSTMESSATAVHDKQSGTIRTSSPGNVLEIFFSNDEIPSIETVLSFSPKSTCSSSPKQNVPSLSAAPTPASTPSKPEILSYDNIETFLQRYGEPEVLNQSLLEYSDSTLSSSRFYGSSTSSDLLLTTMEMVEEQIDAESEARRDLIQQELDDIMDQCHKNGDLMEDEAIEALGIAANEVAFLGSSEESSIAFSIINGSLLQLAARHYFGDSNNFLVQYTPQLRGAIRRMKSNPIQEEKYYSGTDYDYVRRHRTEEQSDDASIRTEGTTTQKLVDLAHSVAWGSWSTAGWVYSRISFSAARTTQEAAPSSS